MAASTSIINCAHLEINRSTSSDIPNDSQSKKGKFGWVACENIYIPYILRGDEKYCAVKMVEMKLLSNFTKHLDDSILSYAKIQSYFITDAEANLLSEINNYHTDKMFGCIQFSTYDLIVTFKDILDLYAFVKFCILSERSSKKKPCGLMKMSNNKVFAYAVIDGEKYVPLYYFKDEYNILLKKAIHLKPWHIVYIKFCLKIIGEDLSYFSQENCYATSMKNIENYFNLKAMHDEDMHNFKIFSGVIKKKAKSFSTNPPAWIQLPSSNRPTPQVFNLGNKFQVAVPQNNQHLDSDSTPININLVSTENLASNSNQTSISSNTRPTLQGSSSKKNILWKKLIPIEDVPLGSRLKPFFTIKNLDRDLSVFCIHSGLITFPEPLVMINDFIHAVCPNMTIERCKYLLQDVWNVNLYAGNKQMMSLLLKQRNVKSEAEVVPFIKLLDVIKLLPALKSHITVQETPVERLPKRPRIN